MTQPIGAGLSLAALFVAFLSIPLQASSQLGLTADQTSAWIMVIYGLAGVLSMIMIFIFRQPLVVTGNIFILIFVLLLGTDLSWPELGAAALFAGALVLGLAITGFTDRLASILPPPIVYGLLAGAVLGLITEMFTTLGHETVLVGSMVVAYFLSRAIWGSRFPSIIAALIVGVAVAVITGKTGPLPALSLPTATWTIPNPTIKALLTTTPVLVIFITLQANAPSIVFLRGQGYQPPEKTISIVSGVATMIGSFFGPMGMSLSLPATALVAGPEAGKRETRHRAGYVASTFGLVIALSAGFAHQLSEFVPRGLLSSLVGLAVLGIMAQSLREITKGPLLMGPLVAFVVSVSDIELLGLGRFFWALVLGLAVSLLLERNEWRSLRGATIGADSGEISEVATDDFGQLPD